MITRKQAQWASYHDWYRAYDAETGIVQCVENGVEQGIEYARYRYFNDLEDLRAWAGY